MINNAGLMPLSPLERLKIDDWNRMIDVNIKGVLYGIAAALPYMKQQKAGHIINVSSVAGHKVRPGNAVYAATKAAVLSISEGLRQEVKPYNIRTTVISPGAVATELPNSVTEPDIAENVRSIPFLPRVVRPGRRKALSASSEGIRYRLVQKPAQDTDHPPGRQREDVHHERPSSHRRGADRQGP
jgi:NADP-dependent 3-hydroxy acid dehydrogenase YdfG